MSLPSRAKCRSEFGSDRIRGRDPYGGSVEADLKVRSYRSAPTCPRLPVRPYSLGTTFGFTAPLACSNLYWLLAIFAFTGERSSTSMTSPGINGFR